jgi:DNA anti-recombination protein RmuC
MPDLCAPSLQEESLPAESTLRTETQEKVGLPGVLTEANRIIGGTSSSQRQLEQLTPEITRWRKANIKILLTETKTVHHHQNPALPPQRVLDTPTQDSYLKSYLMMMVEDFKKEINNSLKEVQENTTKQVEGLKEEAQKSLKELHENTAKQVEGFKEETQKSLKELQENTTKQVMELNKTIQDLKREGETIKKTQRRRGP